MDTRTRNSYVRLQSLFEPPSQPQPELMTYQEALSLWKNTVMSVALAEDGGAYNIALIVREQQTDKTDMEAIVMSKRRTT